MTWERWDAEDIVNRLQVRGYALASLVEQDYVKPAGDSAAGKAAGGHVERRAEPAEAEKAPAAPVPTVNSTTQNWNQPCALQLRVGRVTHRIPGVLATVIESPRQSPKERSRR